ncbi:hypothetical protein WKV44_08780 [Spirochaetia bacterium 38H-sp]|uniref:TonB C-terminal domain-containing protein n=1 Tax=Rarispira pelagica TaxID=3141764 RepID=A0ABU9UD96_9SPIR
MREDLRKQQDKRIKLLSISISAGIYLLIVIALWIAGLLQYQELSDISSPVNIKLKSQGNAPIPQIAQEPPKGTQTPPQPEATPQHTEQNNNKPQPTKQAEKQTPTSTSTKQAASTPRPTQQEQPAEISGQENGSSYNIGFSASAGQVGRSFYVPIYLYMPLPDTLTDTTISYLRIKEPQLQWETIYHQQNDTWLISSQPPIEQRPQYWNALSKAGYNPTKASYKNRPNLKNVKIEFRVDSSKKGSRLTDIKILTSSGYSDIDEAILYGFSQATFFNNTDQPIKGVFTYKF